MPSQPARVEGIEISLSFSSSSAAASQPARVEGIEIYFDLNARISYLWSQPARVEGIEIIWFNLSAVIGVSQPARVEGIEMILTMTKRQRFTSQPARVEGIEMVDENNNILRISDSLNPRGLRGLKSAAPKIDDLLSGVSTREG